MEEEPQILTARRRIATRRHASRACDVCRSKKLKCSGDTPRCQRCVNNDQDCHFALETDRRRKKPHTYHLSSDSPRQALPSLSSSVPELRPDRHNRIGGNTRSSRHTPLDVPARSRSDASTLEEQDYDFSQEDACQSSSLRQFGSGSDIGPSVRQAQQHRRWLPHDSAQGDSYSSGPYADTEIEDGDMDDDDNDTISSINPPYAIGTYHMSSSGRLLVSPHATFYRAAPPPNPTPIPPFEMYEAYPGSSSYVRLFPFLPIDLSSADHELILATAFSSPMTWGMNVGMEQDFRQSMQSDPLGRGPYYSPFLHLTVLAQGSRHLKDRRLAAICSDEDVAYSCETRGNCFITRARSMVDREAESPEISTIVGLYLMTAYLVGMNADQAACTYHALGVFLAQDFRVHRRCDDEMRAAGYADGSPLDVIRRNVYGMVNINNGWWTSYFGRPTLPLHLNSDQKPPVCFAASTKTESEVLSLGFIHHCELARIGMRIVEVVHVAWMSDEQRLSKATRLREQVDKWFVELPRALRWDEEKARSGEIDHPAQIIVLNMMYHTYRILLYRPFIINTASSVAPLAGAIAECFQATQEILAQVRFVRDYHGVSAFPLTMQHILYVAGTMLVLQGSGLGDQTLPDMARAKKDLSYTLRVLEEFSEVWPAAENNAASLRHIAREYMLQ